jgi:hypothetical protein
MAWIARGLLILALLWLVIGMVAARTRLVRRPGAAAARANWLGATRPWRARESTLGLLPLDRWLLLGVPTALLVGTHAVLTSFASWTHLALALSTWFGFVVMVRLLVGGRSPWPVIAAIGGVIVLRCVVALAALSVAGRGGAWLAFRTQPGLRTLYIALVSGLFIWLFVAAGWALNAQIGGRRATGVVVAGIGAGLAVPASIVAVIGQDTVIASWNDDRGPLPWGLAAVLERSGILPDSAAWLAVGVGVLILAIGVLLALPYGRGDRRAETGPPASADLMS